MVASQKNSQSLFVKWFYFPYPRIIFPKLAFVFHVQNDFYIIRDHIDTFCLTLLQKDFYIVYEDIDAFCFSLIKKNQDTFQESFFLKFFLCF